MQLDFTIEAQNNRRFTQHFAADPQVIVPKLHDALCSRRVLTMDFIEGKKILDCSGSQAERRARVLETIGQVNLPDPDQIVRAFPHQLSGGQR